MADAVKKYTLDKNRLARGCAEGFSVQPGGVLAADPEAPHHTLFLGRLDSGTDDCEWGRLSFHAQMDQEMVLIVRAFATSETVFVAEGQEEDIDAFLLNAQRPVRHKLQLFEAAGAIRDSEHQDVLLFGQRGRYLHLSLELFGTGECAIEQLQVWAPGENFYDTFPEVYHTDGEFFRRYLTVFSTLYNEMQERLDRLDEVIDIETAPTELLLVFAEWIGLGPTEDLLDKGQLRSFLRMAWQLICRKGTRQTLERLLALLVGEGSAFIVENTHGQTLARGALGDEGGRAPYHLTILINRPANEQLHARLKRLLGWFRPLRCNMDIVFIEGQNAFDAYCCLDINAAIGSSANGALDGRVILNGTTYLD